MFALGWLIAIAVTLELFWPESDTKGNAMTLDSALAVHAHYENIAGKTHEQSVLLRAAKEVIRKHAEQALRIVHPQPGDA